MSEQSERFAIIKKEFFDFAMNGVKGEKNA